MKTSLKETKYKCLVHLDRLSLTFKHLPGSTFHDIRNPDSITSEQIYKSITLLYDPTPGLGAFYHSFKVLFKGLNVGKLHTATKLKKGEIQFDFDKQVFYSFSGDFWYDVFHALKSELKLHFNNIRYMEISVDVNKNLVETYAHYYSSCINNQLRAGSRYRMRKGITVNVMSNGTSFVISGSENSIGIYNKTAFAEQYILDYFGNNGLANQDVYRIEARLTWNYIRYLRNKRHLNIEIETLLDVQKLAAIFIESTKTKTAFEDTTVRTNDKSGNAHFLKINIIDDLPISTSEIGKLNSTLRINHYKNRIDENICRQNYYRYLETGYRDYIKNFKASGTLAGYTNQQMSAMIGKFNTRYNGNRTSEILHRMELARKHCNINQRIEIGKTIKAIGVKLKMFIMEIHDSISQHNSGCIT